VDSIRTRPRLGEQRRDERGLQRLALTSIRSFFFLVKYVNRADHHKNSLHEVKEKLGEVAQSITPSRLTKIAPALMCLDSAFVFSRTVLSRPQSAGPTSRLKGADSHQKLPDCHSSTLLLPFCPARGFPPTPSSRITSLCGHWYETDLRFLYCFFRGLPVLIVVRASVPILADSPGHCSRCPTYDSRKASFV